MTPIVFFSVTRGLCKILDQKVTLFSETAEESHTIDRERAQAALQHALELLKSGDLSTDEEIEKFQRKVERAQIRLQLAESSSSKSN